MLTALDMSIRELSWNVPAQDDAWSAFTASCYLEDGILNMGVVREMSSRNDARNVRRHGLFIHDTRETFSISQ